MSESITKHHVRPTGPNTAQKFQWLLLLVVKNLALKFKFFFLACLYCQKTLKMKTLIKNGIFHNVKSVKECCT